MTEHANGRRLGAIVAQVVVTLIVGAVMGWAGTVRSGLDSVGDLRTEVAVLKVRLEATNRRLDETNQALVRLTTAIELRHPLSGGR